MAKPKHTNTDRRDRFVTVRFTAQEAAELEARADGEGRKLSEHIRGRVMSLSGVSFETELVLAEVGRGYEFQRRIWRAFANADIELEDVDRIAVEVDAIDSRVLVARALLRNKTREGK